MYKSFYGLTRNPFEISPDPYFLVPTARHNEALASLYYGIRQHKGFVVLTGEVGTGKTLVVRCLLQTLANTGVAFSYVFNPRLSSYQLLQYVMADFGLKANHHKSEMLHELSQFLIQRHRAGQNTALIIDEAQQLRNEALEEIRLMTNLETTEQKLLQILLVGQPELSAKLDSVELRQLKQRIALRCRLKPMRPLETREYVIRRMNLAGANGNADLIFAEETLRAIHGYSQGIPRLVNTICENALIAGFARRLDSIGPNVIREIASDFGLKKGGEPQEGEGHVEDLNALEFLQRLEHELPVAAGPAPKESQ